MSESNTDQHHPPVSGWLAACLLRAREADSISSTELADAPELTFVDMPADGSRQPVAYFGTPRGH